MLTKLHTCDEVVHASLLVVNGHVGFQLQAFRRCSLLWYPCSVDKSVEHHVRPEVVVTLWQKGTSSVFLEIDSRKMFLEYLGCGIMCQKCMLQNMGCMQCI